MNHSHIRASERFTCVYTDRESQACMWSGWMTSLKTKSYSTYACTHICAPWLVCLPQVFCVDLDRSWSHRVCVLREIAATRGSFRVFLDLCFKGPKRALGFVWQVKTKTALFCEICTSDWLIEGFSRFLGFCVSVSNPKYPHWAWTLSHLQPTRDQRKIWTCQRKANVVLVGFGQRRCSWRLSDFVFCANPNRSIPTEIYNTDVHFENSN